MLVSLRCVVIRRCRRDDACRRSAGPAVPPSLAPVVPEPSLNLRPALLGAFALFFRRLRADLHRTHASGLPPSPDRSWLRARLLVPSSPARPLRLSRAASHLAVDRRPAAGRLFSAWSRTWPGARRQETSGSPPGSASPSCPEP